MAKAKNAGIDESKVEQQAPLIPEIPPDIKHIRIILKAYLNITPTYSVSELTVQAKYLGKDLGTTSKTTVIEDDYIPTLHEFLLECDINSSKDLDQLISNPIILSLFESVGEIDNELLLKMGSPPKRGGQEILMTADSAADLSDAFTGKNMDRSTFISDDSKASALKSKSDATKPADKGKDEKIKEKPSMLELPTEPILMGTTTLDLIPLFQGHALINETLLVHQVQKYYDDRIVPTNIMPRLVIQVDIEEETWLPHDPNFNIVSLTIESIYNLPSLMSEEKQYKVSALLPSAYGKWEHTVVPGGRMKNKHEMENPKLWPGMLEDASLGGATNYRIEESLETVKNDIEVNLDVITSEQPRVEWNIIKRNFMLETASREFTKKLKKYRYLPLEVYVTTAEEQPLVPAGGDKGKGKADTSDKGKKGAPEDYLHLMALVNVSTLLYPGINRCRVACPLNTYQEMEILKQTGQENSYFMPRIEEPPGGEKDAKDKKKSEVGSTKSKSTGKESKGAGTDNNKKDLAPLLPLPPPPPPEPSKPVYSENGKRTFILIEIEILKPLSPKRDMEDLSDELSKLFPKKPELPKNIVSSRLAKIYFQDVIKQLTIDLIHQHQHFLKERKHCPCESHEVGDSQAAFLTFLQRTGVYQTYLMSITKATSVIVNEKFPNAGEVNRSNNKEYQNFIGEVYSYLIKELNGVLNILASSGTENSPTSPLMNLDPLLLYAKESSAIGAKLLADRYYLERICLDEKNGNNWFDYAVFQLEIGDREKAFECAKQCLHIDETHHYSLMLCGILLLEKKKYEEAETCFLTVVIQKNNFVEGWGAMHLFYSETGNIEGSDLCLEMANKFLNTPTCETDYFSDIDDLAWSTQIAPHTVFFKTAILLLRMRVLFYAEKALSHELIKNPGVCHYYLAVIMYYRHNYPHALLHLKEAERIRGSDYAIASLTGHCYFTLRKVEKAKEQYVRVLESFNRPDDMHLLYMYLAVIWDQLGDKQAARRLLLTACKHSPTPYTWLTTGILYYGQKDLLSAEQCFEQANLCDNRLPEIWGYLTLINLELQRFSEAEVCYKQAKKNKMRDRDLEKRIQKAMKVLNEEYNAT